MDLTRKGHEDLRPLGVDDLAGPQLVGRVFERPEEADCDRGHPFGLQITNGLPDGCFVHRHQDATVAAHPLFDLLDAILGNDLWRVHLGVVVVDVATSPRH